MSMASPTLILATWVRHGLAVLANLRVSDRARVGWIDFGVSESQSTILEGDLLLVHAACALG